MLSRMSDPQQPAHNPHQVPPYVSQSQQNGYPGQSPQQPAYPQPAAQGYILNGQNSHPASAAPMTANPAGRAGLILGLVGLGLSLLTTLAVQIFIRTDAYPAVGMINALGSLLTFAAALAALILGFVGLRKAGAPHGSAGIAAGLGIAGVVGIAFSFLVNTVGALLSY